MIYEKANISTRDGVCPVHVFTSNAGTRLPAIIFYMDAGALGLLHWTWPKA
jgi:carboxymethylenebutenolidase